MQNGFSSTQQTTSEIKAAAADAVERATKGFSALSMLRQAKLLIQYADDEERAGNLPAAFSNYAKAAHLVRKTMASPEHLNEKTAGGQGVLSKEIREFLEADGKELGQKFTAVEAKLKALEPKSSPPPDGPITKSGGSIADRLRSLQESSGTAIGTTKRFGPRDFPSVPKTPPGRSGPTTNSSTSTNTSTNGHSRTNSITNKPSLPKLDNNILTPTIPPSTSTQTPTQPAAAPSQPAKPAPNTVLSPTLPPTTANKPPPLLPSNLNNIGPSSSSASSSPKLEPNHISSSITSPTHSKPPFMSPNIHNHVYSSSSSASGSLPPSPSASSHPLSHSHTFVPPSALGPPSPSSTPTSSPQNSQFDVSFSEFHQNFPPIDELEAHLSGGGNGFTATGGSAEGGAVVKPMATGSSVKSKTSAGKLKNGVPPGSSSNAAVQGLGLGGLASPTSPSFPAQPIQTQPLSPVLAPAPAPVSPNPGSSKPPVNDGGTPYRPFSMSLGLGLDRPSSTPITPSAPPFISRTPSPTQNGKQDQNQNQMQPLVPAPVLGRKPSLLSGLPNGTGVYPVEEPTSPPPLLASGHAHTHTHTPEPELSALPGHSNTITPQALHQYMASSSKRNVLFLDVRPRETSERERVKAGYVVCVEPGVLRRGRVTSQDIEDSLTVAPANEHELFANRDKFDLVVIYDTNSTSPLSSQDTAAVAPHVSPSISALHASQQGTQSTEISTLITSIYVDAKQKFLRRMPVLLVGGIEAWKRDIGEAGIVRGSGATLGLGIGGVASQGGSPKGAGAGLQRPLVPNGVPAVAVSPHQQQQQQQSRARSGTETAATPRGAAPPAHGIAPNGYLGEHRSHASVDFVGHSRVPAESSTSYANGSAAPLARRPAIISRGNSSSSFASPTFSPPPLASSTTLMNGHASQPITYPSFNRRSSVQALNTTNTPYSPSVTIPSTSASSSVTYDGISPPPVAVSPSLSLYRRNSRGFDRPDPSMPNSGVTATNNSLRSSTSTIVEYPSVSVLRPPPPVAASPLAERQDNRPRQPTFTPSVHSPSASAGMAKLPNGLIKPPRIASDYPVTYWSGTQIATTGLKNLGNTCYMNATIQCLSATVPFARFFNDGRWKSAINYQNSLGTKGHIAMAFATILHELWHGDLPYITPFEFRKSMGSHKSLYATSDQQDSQEFLSFLLDGIHEDLNRVISKPNWTKTPAQEAELETLLPQIASEQEWMLWQTRNDSIIVDFFQGQLRNRLKCSTCGQTSTTYNAFSLLQLPIPSARGGKVPLQKCFEAYCNREIMEGDDAWDCPKCKTKRKATKELSLSRLPPILIIHLKRFESNGRFSDKMDTLVDFPLQSLDLTDFMPGPLPSGADKRSMNVISPEDPRTQIPPYRYDLYGVTNHYGNLSSGHYTAFVASRGGWMLCDDSTVRAVDAKQVVNQRAYVLFYKRVKV